MLNCASLWGYAESCSVRIRENRRLCRLRGRAL